jgi:hypothetical protein
MTIKDLPASLIEASKTILDESVEQYTALYEKYMMLGLSRFGVKRESQLNEIDRRALSAWVQVQLSEAASCGMKVEDCMPNDEVFYTPTGEKKKELGEESDDETESDSEELDEVMDLTKGSEEDATKRAIDDFTKSDSSRFEGKSKEDRIKMAIAAVKSARGTSKNEEVEKTDSKLNEGIAIEPDEVATNGAFAIGDAENAKPVHADILRDSNPVTAKNEFRLLLQYATKEAIKIYPSMDMPAATSIADLKTVVESMPFYNKEVEDALNVAMQVERE